MLIIVLIAGTPHPAGGVTADFSQKKIIWDGKVTVVGVKMVPEGTTLVILPGTQVKFEYVDEDGDERGASGINVQGSIYAVGTDKDPITFYPLVDEGTSGMWRGIQIDNGNMAHFSNCSFKGAQWALHNHFTPLTVEYSRFLSNDGGIKFRGNPVRLEGNYFSANGTAVRYLESDPDIRSNTFTGNDTAIFCREGSSQSTIRDNNFLMSASYHIKLGELQSEDIDGANNYWGTVSSDEIEEKIYDKMDTSYLGRVDFLPYRATPIFVSPGDGSSHSPALMIDQDASHNER